jgi:poly-gamma-glutamate capsule biosynthesis protein CapA/YwtB (metallophosphatase superfamily)
MTNSVPDRGLRIRTLLPAAAPALLLFFTILSLAAWRQPPVVSAEASAANSREISRVTFVVAGDVIPHQAVVDSAAAQAKAAKANAGTQEAAVDPHGGWDALFSGVADVFRQADFGFVNLETPVAPVASRGSKPFQFDAPVALLQSLKASGVKVVSFANNHVFDQGQAGFAETQGHLREQGLLFVGAAATAEDAWKPIILEKDGIKIGWLGMTRWLNGHHNPVKDSEAHVAFLPYPGSGDEATGLSEAGLLDAIKAARAQCDLLLISIHWGVEYSPDPLPHDVELAHRMLEAGAGMVIGHHPHVLQQIETYVTQDQRNGVIFFSLGNFLANQSRTYVNGLMPDKTGEPRDSIIARFAVIKRDYGPGGIRVEVSNVGIMPVWIENNHLLMKSGKEKEPDIRPVFMDRELARLQARLDELGRSGPDLTPEQKQEWIRVSSLLELLKHRRELLLARTGDEYLVAPPSPDPANVK